MCRLRKSAVRFSAYLSCFLKNQALKFNICLKIKTTYWISGGQQWCSKLFLQDEPDHDTIFSVVSGYGCCIQQGRHCHQPDVNVVVSRGTFVRQQHLRAASPRRSTQRCGSLRTRGQPAQHFHTQPAADERINQLHTDRLGLIRQHSHHIKVMQTYLLRLKVGVHHLPLECF